MKTIDISKINSYSRFVTKGLKEAKFISYQPEAKENNRLIFMVEGNIILTDEKGKCYTINGYDSSYSDASGFPNFDIFVDDIQRGWINILKSNSTGDIVSMCSGEIYNSFQTAKKFFNDDCLKTVQIEWVIEDDNEN